MNEGKGEPMIGHRLYNNQEATLRRALAEDEKRRNPLDAKEDRHGVDLRAVWARQCEQNDKLIALNERLAEALERIALALEKRP